MAVARDTAREIRALTEHIAYLDAIIARHALKRDSLREELSNFHPPLSASLRHYCSNH